MKRVKIAHGRRHQGPVRLIYMLGLGLTWMPLVVGCHGSESEPPRVPAALVERSPQEALPVQPASTSPATDRDPDSSQPVTVTAASERSSAAEKTAYQALLARYGRPAPNRGRLREWARDQVNAIQAHLDAFPDTPHAISLRHWQAVNLIDVLGDQKQALAVLDRLDRQLRLQSGPESETARQRALRLRIRLHRRANQPEEEAQAIHGLLPGLQGREHHVMAGRMFELKCLAPGCVMPAFAGRDLQGKTFDSARARGRVMILDFWDAGAPTWEQGILDRRYLLRKHGGQDLVVVGVPLIRSRATVQAIVTRTGANWPQLLDPERPGNDHVLARQFTPSGRPTVFVIDRRGVIRARDPDGAALRRQVEQLIREPVDFPE